MNVSKMTHDEIADFGALRLRKMGYKFSCSNLTSVNHGEQPDVLGIDSYGQSIVLESKVSRSDFKADLKKPWRVNPIQGMGDRRVYITPKGLLKPCEIPYGWMLWEVHGKTRPIIKVIKGESKRLESNPVWGGKSMIKELVNCDADEFNFFNCGYKKSDFKKELTWMVHVMGRAIDDGFEPNDYANNYQLKSKGSQCY